ncbi:hypothetical protein FHS57_004909 [Runella defluvii]|uniref:Uncharacterized protein n=1 Tax=Runella defluvii TaxID=370973 RepID=A0A7W5ZNY0_9BACT|nr:hypothetical protein [Runella defluvii]
MRSGVAKKAFRVYKKGDSFRESPFYLGIILKSYCAFDPISTLQQF